MSISYKTPGYFTRFSCLGSECEDTCCRNWEVKLDREHYDLLGKVTSADEHEAGIFNQYVRLNENSITSDHDYAFIRMGVNGYCAMLDNNGLCSIHAKYGVSALGNVCTMFPRIVSRCENTIELSGALSCPEVVRLCISDSTPLKMSRFKPADLPRSKNYPIHRELSTIADDFYSKYFSIVRDHLRNILSDESEDFETRLYLLTTYANKISAFYHRGCSDFSADKISVIYDMLREKKFVSKMNEYIKNFETDAPISMIVVHSILSIKLQQAEDENISLVYQKLIQKYLNDDSLSESLAAELLAIRESISETNRAHLDKALTRYILNCLHREWFVSMPDPFTYIQMLLVRITILRTLLYLDIGLNTELNESELNKKIVFIMYNFARNIDQNLEFLKVVYNALSEQTMMTFDFSPAFIRLR
ncbi:MAG: flagellin lysine-N-methylase [Gammaproteobacteria bacterium]|nr:flagellin lysine-N-methylase [Gammaproteobacteria bacterium]